MSIKFEKVNYIYSPNTPFANHALKDIDLEIEPGKMTAIIGETGSGKSTLVQHLNALLLPSDGKVTVFEKEITHTKPKNILELRKNVGLVFQFPEYQLFEETVIKDVAFGPKNFGLSEEESLKQAAKSLSLVGIPSDLYENSPLDLSGGQKRRVAIAGIIAMNPNVLVLDEPTAGLDPASTKEMMNLFKDYNQKQNKTVIMVTHDMQQVLDYCDKVVVIKEGRVYCNLEVQDFFSNPELLEEAKITPPTLIAMQYKLRDKGFILDKAYLDQDSLVEAIRKKVSHG